MTDLASLSSPSKAKILSFPKNGVFLRLREMGLCEQIKIKKLRQALFFGPVEIEFLYTKIMLRKTDAEKIKVERIK